MISSSRSAAKAKKGDKPTPFLRGKDERCRILRSSYTNKPIDIAREYGLRHGDVLVNGTWNRYIVDESDGSLNILDDIMDDEVKAPSANFIKAFADPLKFYEAGWNGIVVINLDHAVHYDIIYGAAGSRHVSDTCVVLYHTQERIFYILVENRGVAALSPITELEDGIPVARACVIHQIK